MTYTIESLFNKSSAYLEVAIISSKAKDSLGYNTSEYTNVTANLLHHATELFLKFAISAKTKELPDNEHNIKKLFKKYKKLFPDEKYHIEVPFTNEVEYLGFSQKEIEQHKKDFPMPFELQLRYPFGSKGERYSPITKYDTDFLEHCQEEFLKLRCQIHPSQEVEGE